MARWNQFMEEKVKYPENASLCHSWCNISTDTPGVTLQRHFEWQLLAQPSSPQCLMQHSEAGEKCSLTCGRCGLVETLSHQLQVSRLHTIKKLSTQDQWNLPDPETFIVWKEGQVEPAPEQVQDAECQEGESQKLASLVRGGNFFPFFATVHLQNRFNALVKVRRNKFCHNIVGRHLSF